MNQLEKGQLFRSLHYRDRPFIIPNPWDAGTARLLAGLGFEALATTSAGYAFSQGKPDYSIPRDEMLQHAAELVRAADLPVSADLENGYGKSLNEVAETYRLAAQTGLVGASIEDATGNPTNSIFELSAAADRVRAAAETVHTLPFPFTLTARAENFLHGRQNLGDTIARLQAFQEAGADVLYAPGLAKKEDIATVVKSVDRPVNVLAALRDCPLTLVDFAALGVKRISVGSALSRAALGAFLRAAREMQSLGSFSFTQDAVPYPEISKLLI